MFVRYPTVDGPTIKKVTDYLSGNEILTRAALNVGYQHLLRCREVAVSNPKHPDSQRIIGESFSALVGAVLAEQGVGEANNFALDMLVPLLEGVDLASFANIHVNPKQYLFSLLHREGGGSPTYTILQETGRQSHSPMFLVGVFAGDEKLAEGASYSLKDAKNEAAKAALRMRYSQELGPNTELPESWGDFSLEDTKEYISEKE
jgi:large subunit ribosomal protein L44